MDRLELAHRLRHLVIFRALGDKPLVAALTRLLESDSPEQAADCCCDLAAELYPLGGNLAQALAQMVLCDDHFYIRGLARGQKPPCGAAEWLSVELKALAQAAAWAPEQVEAAFPGLGPIPRWQTERLDLEAMYHQQLQELSGKGYGIFARYHVFTLAPDGELTPVVNPDPQRLSQLYGYETQRNMVLKNTLALLDGLPANNMLLYGDAGTGKSSTVKAIANELYPRGLRLIQADKDQLHLLPALLDRLGGEGLKFIIFIDDLSFSSNDREFTALKTILEGSVSARSDNTVIYATSNRRHLVKERFSDRQGDEVHVNDSIEEAASLSARFGITVTFEKPGKDLYVQLVEKLAAQYGLQCPDGELTSGAEAYALRSGGRSPRVARQYIEYKMAMER